jgi:hypothetical protein
LVFEYGDLLFKAFREQWNCFKAQRKEVLLSIESRTSADAGTESEKEKSDGAKRKKKSGPKQQKAEAKKYYVVAVGRKTGVFTTWDEAGRSVSKYSGCVFKSFKHKAEAKAWLWEKRRQQPRRRRRAPSSGDRFLFRPNKQSFRPNTKPGPNTKLPPKEPMRRLWLERAKEAIFFARNTKAFRPCARLDAKQIRWCEGRGVVRWALGGRMHGNPRLAPSECTAILHLLSFSFRFPSSFLFPMPPHCLEHRCLLYSGFGKQVFDRIG